MAKMCSIRAAVSIATLTFLTSQLDAVGVSATNNDTTTTSPPSGGGCPPGYIAILYDLEGAGKEFHTPVENRTVADCGAICDTRLGCTAFEAYYAGPQGYCLTYTAGNANIDTNTQYAGWQSCASELWPIQCPSGFTPTEYNLDGVLNLDKRWAPADASRTIDECGALCWAREGCTAFEYFAGAGKHKGLCGTYTKGAENIGVPGGENAHMYVDPAVRIAWQSCLVSSLMPGGSLNTNSTTSTTSTTASTVLFPCPGGFASIDQNLDGTSGMDKVWEPVNAMRTAADCAAICLARAGCTAFEYFTGIGESYAGLCGTYVGGAANVVMGSLQARYWLSCMNTMTTTTSASTETTASTVSTATTVTTAPVFCPAGFSAVEFNLDGAVGSDKQWTNVVRIADCADVCSARPGCTSFEFSLVGPHAGACATYISGAANIESGVEQQSGWLSCINT